jgi:zinc-ribbon domain
MSYCSNCGQAAGKGAKFCANCGKPLASAAAPGDVASSQPPSASSIAEAATSQPRIGDSPGSSSEAAASGRKGDTTSAKPANAKGRRKIGYAVGVIVYWIAQGSALLLVDAISGPSDPNDVGPGFLTKVAFGWLIGGFVSALIGRYVAKAIAADIKDSTLRTVFTVTLIVSGLVSLALLGFSLLGFILAAGMVLAFYAGLHLATSI